MVPIFWATLYIDFNKAFDSASHNKLFFRFANYGQRVVVVEIETFFQ